MASAQVVETSVTNNSPSHDSSHPDVLFQSCLEFSVVNHLLPYFLQDFQELFCFSHKFSILLPRRCDILDKKDTANFYNFKSKEIYFFTSFIYFLFNIYSALLQDHYL